MRIAYVSSDRGIPVHGIKGASIHVRGMAQALMRRGHEVRIVSARAGGEPPGGFLPQVIEVGFDRLLKDLRHGIRSDGHTDLGNETCALLSNTVLSQALERLDDSWGIDAVYERYSLWSWAALQYARCRNVPFILELNAPLVDEQQRWRQLSLQPVAAGLERVVLKEADAISVPASYLKTHIERVTGRRRGVHVIPNGVDLDLFRHPDPVPAALRKRLRGRFVVAFLGSLKPWHGIESLWQAFLRLRERIPTAHLLVIGDGPMRAMLEEAGSACDPGALTLTGAVPHAAVPGLLACADVGVAPYPRLDDFYFCPLKVIEYMAAGLPVIGSDLGDMGRLVSHGRTGWLVPPGEPKALAHALLELHGGGRRYQAFGTRARRRAEARFGWDVSAGRVENLILKAMRSRASAEARHLRMVATA